MAERPTRDRRPAADAERFRRALENRRQFARRGPTRSGARPAPPPIAYDESGFPIRRDPAPFRARVRRMLFDG